MSNSYQKYFSNQRSSYLRLDTANEFLHIFDPIAFSNAVFVIIMGCGPSYLLAASYSPAHQQSERGHGYSGSNHAL